MRFESKKKDKKENSQIRKALYHIQILLKCQNGNLIFE